MKTVSSSMLGISGYLYCPVCKLGRVKKDPKSSYEENYYAGKSGFISSLFSPIGLFFYKIRSSYINFKNPNLWIDVGAGEGRYLKNVTAKRKIGVEISIAGRNMMKKLNLETMSNTEFLKTNNLKADVISFWHVLEHVEDPILFLKSASKNLQTEGRVIIGIPSIDSFEFYLFKKHWFHLAPMHHIWFFSPKSLSIMLEKTNFKIEKIDYWSLEHHLTGILQSFINKTNGSDNVLHRLVKRKENFLKVSVKDLFLCTFWLTIGFPVIFIFWVIGSLFHKSGTIVLVARKG